MIRRIGWPIHLIGELMTRLTKWFAASALLFVNTAFGTATITLSPPAGGVLYGDKSSTSVKACVMNGSTGVANATFTGAVYFQGGYNWSFGAKLNGVNTNNTIVTIPNIATDATGCATIPVQLWGLPPTTSGFGYSAYVTISSSVFTSPGNAVVNFTVNKFTYSVTPTALSKDGQYPINVVVSAVGSNDFHGLYLSGSCTSQAHPTVSLSSTTNPPSAIIGNNNTATFTLNASGMLFTDPTAPATAASCYYSIWIGDTSITAGQTQIPSTNTCLLGLSPGDPNCGPMN
jgi:hypothetical protein